ncbi:hypothetical protein SORBI_3001G523050 [Sorghum bicolor]|uniref:Uncharacterized protein n=1 Tax=Sorghum bicolor TaxID=4558 RepID=A0A1Z5SBZ4_SORBI|nr:hypothetical protein SORBI_3001G523050 [Sorghum bicolor]
MDVWAIVDHDIRGKWTDGERMSRAAGPGLALPPLLSSSSSSLSMRRHSRTQDTYMGLTVVEGKTAATGHGSSSADLLDPPMSTCHTR